MDLIFVKNIKQDNLIAFKASDVIKNRLEILAEKSGLNVSGYLRGLIDREYSLFTEGV